MDRGPVKLYDLRATANRAVVASILVVLTCAHAGAQQSEIDALNDRLDDLAAMIEAQSKVIEDQAAEIRQLKANTLETVVRLAEPAPGQEISISGQKTKTSDQVLGRFPDDSVVRAGDFENAIKFPGSDASFGIGGFVRAEAAYDFDSLGFQDVVNHRTIPIDGSSRDGANQSRFHVRNSRVNLDYRRPSRLGDIRAFVEFDFFGGGDEFINNYEVRIRHVAAQVGDVYVGQWWSQFTDIASSPETIDFGPPLGQPVQRNPGIRWARNFGADKSWRAGVGIENPAGDLTDTSELFASDSVPNFTGFIEKRADWGRLKIAALALQLDSETGSTLGGGINISGRYNTPWIAERDNIVFGLTAGEGFTHYYSPLAGVGLEGVIDADGDVEATGILGGFLGYQHWWTDRIRSTFVASALELDSPMGSTPTSFDNGDRFRANLFWSPEDEVSFGIEYGIARQQTVDGSDGDGSRLHFLAQVNF